MEHVCGPEEGDPLDRIYELLRVVAAQTYSLTPAEAARLSRDQLKEVAATIGDPPLSWRIAWAEQDAAVAEAKRILELEGDD